jgi:hypothetical protein
VDRTGNPSDRGNLCRRSRHLRLVGDTKRQGKSGERKTAPSDEQLKTIHRLIGLYLEQFHNSQPGLLATRLQLRSELVVTPILLPNCLELADPQPPFDLSTINAQADAALTEVEEAQREIWRNQEVGRIRSLRGDDG